MSIFDPSVIGLAGAIGDVVGGDNLGLTAWVKYGPRPTEWEVFPGAFLVAGAALADANATKIITDGAQFLLPAGTLSANRTFTANVTSAVTGEIMRIVRLDAGAFTYAIINGGPGGTTLITLPASGKRVVDLRFDGTDWALAGVARLA